jgi:hypothetical protein
MPPSVKLGSSATAMSTAMSIRIPDAEATTGDGVIC